MDVFFDNVINDEVGEKEDYKKKYFEGIFFFVGKEISEVRRCCFVKVAILNVYYVRFCILSRYLFVCYIFFFVRYFKNILENNKNYKVI